MEPGDHSGCSMRRPVVGKYPSEIGQHTLLQKKQLRRKKNAKCYDPRRFSRSCFAGLPVLRLVSR